MMKALLADHIQYVDAFYNDNVDALGQVNSNRNFFNTYKKGNLDSVTPARPLFYLSESKNFLKYKLLINSIFYDIQEHPTIPEIGDNYIHKVNSENWINYPFGLDGIYSSLVFLMEIAKQPDIITKPINSAAIYAEVYRRMLWIAENLKDENGLYNHGINRNGKLNGVVWLRGVGWYAIAQFDIIELMPEGKYKEEMKKRLAQFFDNMLIYRDNKSKMWYNVLNSDVKNNRIETSGSAMMAYALMKSCNNNFVEDTKYCYAGMETFDSIIKHKVKRNLFGYKVIDIYLKSNVRENAQEYCNPKLYINDDAKGLAPLILAAEEAKKLKDKMEKSK